MFTKTKIALFTTLFLSAASPVLAEGADYNPRDRHSGPVAQTRDVAQRAGYQHAPAALNVRNSTWEKQWMARASQLSDR
jgi:hypothetical protein